MPGPLTGIRIVELAGIGPGPFCGMMLADHGAEVIRVERPEAGGDPRGAVARRPHDPMLRGRTSMTLDLKSADDIGRLRDVVKTADGLIEGFRPGVMERLGLGPDVLLGDNPRLVYGRMTGWGQDGPYAGLPGHDINYLALSGALAAMGTPGQPPDPPLNLVADFGGGGMLLAVGVLAALVEAGRTGHGQVVDAAMLDGSALQMTMMYELFARGAWSLERGSNVNDGGAPFYSVYQTADGRHVAVGAMEPKFFDELLTRMGLDRDTLPDQWDRARWPELKAILAAAFRTRTRDEWCDLLEHEPVCVTPVLDLREAPEHPHNVHRGTFRDNVPAPAPRFTKG